MILLTPGAVRWAEQAVGPGAAVRSVRRLAGSMYSTLLALDIEWRTQSIPCVLRCYDRAEHLEDEPDAAQHEAAALTYAHAAGLASPALLACDSDGTVSGGSPKLLMARMPGKVMLIPDDLSRWLYELAAALLPVHAVSAEHFSWRFRPYADLPRLTPPRWSRVPQAWEQAIAFAQSPPPAAPERFLHRDYHPNNVLWTGGKVSGIVDWPSACVGAANVDVSWCRHNLKSLYGVPAADAFLAAYQAEAGASFTYHPYWDLLALMEALPGPPALYSPWAEFGMDTLTVGLLRERTDDYLESVLRRL